MNVSDMTVTDEKTVICPAVKRSIQTTIDGQNCMLGYLGRIIDDHGPDA